MFFNIGDHVKYKQHFNGEVFIIVNRKPMYNQEINDHICYYDLKNIVSNNYNVRVPQIYIRLCQSPGLDPLAWMYNIINK